MGKTIFKDGNEKKEVYDRFLELQGLYLEGTIETLKYEGFFMNKALERMKEKPLECLFSWVRNIPRLWYQHYVQMYAKKEASGFFFILYFVLSIAAIIFALPEDKKLMAPIALLFIYLTFVFLPQPIEPRYGVTAIPSIIILVGIGFWRTISFVTEKLQKAC